MASHSAHFIDQKEKFAADTCEPLVHAAESGALHYAAFARGAYPGRRLVGRRLEGVCTVGYWDAVMLQDWGLGWHRNEGIELTFLERGSLNFSVDASDHRLKAGALTVTRPWQLHRVGNPRIQPSRLYWLILDVGVRRPNQRWRWPRWLMLAPENLARLTTLLSHNEAPVWTATKALAECWRRVGRAIDDHSSPWAQSRLQIALNELLLLLLEMIEAVGPKLDSQLTSSLRTVELFLAKIRDSAEMRAHPWKVASMAESCGLGITQFMTLGERVVNTSPARYLLQCRVAAAKQLLAEQPDLSVTEIALSTGFGSSQYFATSFKRETGQSPKDFRRKIHSEKPEIFPPTR